MSQDRFEKIFIRLVKAYVNKYKEHSFEISLDEKKCQLIGDSRNIIKVKITNSKQVFKRIFSEGSLGLGESYCEGLIHVDDRLYKYFLFIFVRAIHDKRLLFSLPLTDIFFILKARFKRTFFERESKSENINSHYSLSDWFDNSKDANDFYLFWLNSEYIQYSCGKWDEDTRTINDAQLNKLNFYAKRLGIDKSSRGKTLLDLGCGWGGGLFFMAENFGIKCTGITLSTAQSEFIKEEAKRRGLERLITVEVKDAHDMTGKFDFVLSIGILEHISNYDDLYEKTANVLKLGSPALFHAMFHTEMFYGIDTFLSKYIFPGGTVPNLRKNLRIFRKYFRYVDRNYLPENSYPKTLDCWYHNFCANEAGIRKLLAEKSKVKDIDFSIRVFKHYLTLAHCGLSDKYTLVANILVKK
ncbi:MAG: class I SAM-dependent methyltransferase [bacterium]|nr:class I SAM-dependent methyltransferase [bacterium]